MKTCKEVNDERDAQLSRRVYDMDVEFHATITDLRARVRGLEDALPGKPKLGEMRGWADKDWRDLEKAYLYEAVIVAIDRQQQNLRVAWMELVSALEAIETIDGLLRMLGQNGKE